MSKMSERIRNARISCHLTAKQLARLAGTSEKSIIRYENDQSTPETATLIQLAAIFALSTDYLLGLSDNADASFLEFYRKKSIFYRNLQNNHIQKETDYYWLEYSPEQEAFPMRGQMQWAGMDGETELYALRPIIPENCLSLLHYLGKDKPLILNCREDFYVFLNYGGIAFAAEAVCQDCVPHLFRPGPVL